MHELAGQVSDYQSLKRTISDLEHKLKEIEAEIKEYMGEQEELLVDGLTVRWKTVTSSRFDVTAFKAQHETLYKQFLTEAGSRRFQIT